MVIPTFKQFLLEKDEKKKLHLALIGYNKTDMSISAIVGDDGKKYEYFFTDGNIEQRYRKYQNMIKQNRRKEVLDYLKTAKDYKEIK